MGPPWLRHSYSSKTGSHERSTLLRPSRPIAPSLPAAGHLAPTNEYRTHQRGGVGRLPRGLREDKVSIATPPDQTRRGRLEETRDNLVARIVKAEHKGWLGEIKGLQVGLADEDKPTQVDALI